jgi:hypothetical protein
MPYYIKQIQSNSNMFQLFKKTMQKSKLYKVNIPNNGSAAAKKVCAYCKKPGHLPSKCPRWNGIYTQTEEPKKPKQMSMEPSMLLKQRQIARVTNMQRLRDGEAMRISVWCEQAPIPRSYSLDDMINYNASSKEIIAETLRQMKMSEQLREARLRIAQLSLKPIIINNVTLDAPKPDLNYLSFILMPK